MTYLIRHKELQPWLLEGTGDLNELVKEFDSQFPQYLPVPDVFDESAYERNREVSAARKSQLGESSYAEAFVNWLRKEKGFTILPYRVMRFS